MSADASQIIIVLGMHRSGTSLLTDLLSHCGVTLPADLLPAIKGINDQGFFEDAEVVSINELILSSLNSSWYDLRRLPENWMSSLGQDIFIRALKHVKEVYLPHKISLLKDPRLCLLAPFWSAIFQEAGVQQKYIISSRRVSEVAHSLELRDSIPVDAAVILWLNYSYSALDFASDFPCLVVDFEHVLERPEEVLLSISESLSIPGILINDLAKSRIRSSQRKNFDSKISFSFLSELNDFSLALADLLSSYSPGDYKQDSRSWWHWHNDNLSWIGFESELLKRMMQRGKQLHDLGAEHQNLHKVLGESIDREATYLGRINRKLYNWINK